MRSQADESPDPRAPRFEIPENAHETVAEAIEKVNQILDSGQAAKIEHGGARGHAAAYAYDDRVNEQVFFSVYSQFDGRSYHAYGYGTDPSNTAFSSWSVIAGWGNPVTAVPLEESPIYHAAYGTKSPTTYWDPDEDEDEDEDERENTEESR